MTSVLSSFSSQSLFTQKLNLISGNGGDQASLAPGVRRVEAFVSERSELFEGVLARGLNQGLGVELPAEPEVDPESSLFDVEKVVDTVLNFIGTRIGQAQNAGASESEVEGLFDAARQGVEKGFSQARGDLRALGRTDETLFERVDEAEVGINEGIDDLQEDVLGDGDDDFSVDLPAVQSSGYSSRYERNTESFAFELTTQDGDKVSIYALSDQASASDVALSTNPGRTALSVSQTEFAELGFSLSVEGVLDEAEQQAIVDLLTQVDAVSEQFYNGNIGAAFELALQVTSDPQEIASFSLNLTQSQVSVVETGYQQSGYTKNLLPRGIAGPLADFANEVREAYSLANQFEEPRVLLQQLFDQLDAQRRVSTLVEPLLTVLDAQS